ncbi:MAG: hypothetical protein AB7O92_01375 [Acidimicrobiia bacterium]
MVDTWTPAYLTGYPAVVEQHGVRLSQLIGRRLTAVWLLWADERGEAEPWFCDAPVLLDFGGEQVEIDHCCSERLSITWNTIDPADASRWCAADVPPSPEGYGPLRWRRDVVDRLTALEGATLVDLELWVPVGDTPEQRRQPVQLDEASVWPSFRFADRRLTVMNTGDENGLRFGARYRDVEAVPLRPGVPPTLVRCRVPPVADPRLPSVWTDPEGLNGWSAAPRG